MARQTWQDVVRDITEGEVQPQVQTDAARRAAPVARAKRLGVAALVLGLLPLGTFWLGWGSVFGVVLGAAAVVLGSVAGKKLPKKDTGTATAAVAFGAAGIALNILGFLAVLAIAWYSYSH